ncbi:hypothetical protein [Paraburkholderia bryophila]|uniref:Restriction endonuclease n=1 Tax=Paraburkholderia bryophila TaxID=420952 RepID=A0A7Y9W4K1_9BURK|nr:hypothetical protein [Paraburkholderia bryophila]NYH13561.1 hypothetical protein [Paraburkholderia bryophila]
MIKAIETKYRGYRFRSRLEARWAIFFDCMGIEWEYEVEGYDLGKSGWYLPDFRIQHPAFPDFYSLVEIKGQMPTREEVRKLAECNIKQDYDLETDVFSGSCNFLLVGMPDINTPCIQSYRDNEFGGGLVIEKPRAKLGEVTLFLLGHRYRTITDHYHCINVAAGNAKSARFEFGEQEKSYVVAPYEPPPIKMPPCADLLSNEFI